jgi:spermidine/putrescine-binding protein
MSNYNPGKYYNIGWQDRYAGKDKLNVKPADWSDVMHSEYLTGYSDCSNRIVSEAQEAHTKNRIAEGTQFLQE